MKELTNDIIESLKKKKENLLILINLKENI